MKECVNCGHECVDDAVNCPACSNDTFVSSSPTAIGGHVISPAEHRFWKRMTFRQFAVFTIRLQALWFLFTGIVSATYLEVYFGRFHEMFSGYVVLTETRRAFFWALFRVLWHVAGAIICLRYADRIVSWFVKDLIPRRPTETTASNVPPPPGK